MRQLMQIIKKINWNEEAPDWVSLPVVVFFLSVVFAWLQIIECMRR